MGDLRRVLLVGSSLPPFLPANVHRIRQLCWSLRSAGWEAEVLAPEEAFQNAEWRDPRGYELFPADVPRHAVESSRPDWIRTAGIRGMGWRAWWPMACKGSELLQSGRFMLVYISTTQFNFFCLGSWWRQRHSIPCVLDFQDPWYRPGQSIETTTHRLKANLGNRIARILERWAVQEATGLVSVSPYYLTELRSRYPRARCFRGDRTAVIPFGFTEADFALPLPKKPATRKKQIVYVGVGAELMAKSFRRILEGLKRLLEKEPEKLKGIKIRLYGTDGRWKLGQPKILQNLAEKMGMGGLVEEDPTILAYSRSLELMKEADGLLVLGVEDPAYMPSKLFSYSRSGKPLLASLVEGTQAKSYFQGTPEIGHLITFGKTERSRGEETEIQEFLEEVMQAREFQRPKVREKYSDQAMSGQHADIFEKCIGAKR